VLLAEAMRPDLIEGCSSGALFGATIAFGLSGREALDAAVTLWSAELTQQRRWRACAQLVAPCWLGVDAGFGMRDAAPIAKRIRHLFGERRLEDLPTPMRVVATEAASGDGRRPASTPRVAPASVCWKSS
jgi:NTE family protein